MWGENAAVSLNLITPANLVSLMKSQHILSHRREYQTGLNNAVCPLLYCCFHYSLALSHKKKKMSSLPQNKYHSWYSFLCTCLLQCFVVWKKSVKSTQINLIEWGLLKRHNDYQMNDTVGFSTDWLIPSLFIRQPHLSCDRLTGAEQWPMGTAQTWDRKPFIIYVGMANSLWRQRSKERHSSYVITEQDVCSIVVLNVLLRKEQYKKAHKLSYTQSKWAFIYTQNHIL